ncbi:MAG: hypothetical protein AB8H47_09680 [Bacteroidia bacterium]
MAELMKQIFALSTPEQLNIALAILQRLQEESPELSNIAPEQLSEIEKTFALMQTGSMPSHKLAAFKARLEKRIAG